MSATPQSRIEIDPAVVTAAGDFVVPEPLGFGRCLAPVVFLADYQDGQWGRGRLLPYGPLGLDPAAKVLHYAQVVFEGLKAYHVGGSRPMLFRPEMNWRRMNRSAARMMMPALPRDLFMDGLLAVTACSEPYIPRASGRSLYLRPALFATQPTLDPAPSTTFTFMVVASPSEALASGPLRVVVERTGARAVAGGTGDVKVSGNYGAALHATAVAAQSGFDQPLWLDAISHRYIEELSVMNFFAVVDGALHTPELNGTILPGVTRDSILALARLEGLRVHERLMDVDELLQMIRSGRCTEAFACGTAIIVGSIGLIGEHDGRLCPLPEPEGPHAGRLRERLLGIQEGREPDPFAWTHTVAPLDTSAPDRNG
ncbi:MAG: branched-chain amino acid aminotransferase [Gammaproteobacteria bacterium]|nr:branched-chain amino acid aminotransferase [Gammaproteobacteria bacterium]